MQENIVFYTNSGEVALVATGGKFVVALGGLAFARLVFESLEAFCDLPNPEKVKEVLETLKTDPRAMQGSCYFPPTCVRRENDYVRDQRVIFQVTENFTIVWGKEVEVRIPKLKGAMIALAELRSNPTILIPPPESSQNFNLGHIPWKPFFWLRQEKILCQLRIKIRDSKK